ncbi:hypothetical protein GCM10023148_14430 [Actinokineospora soli]
MAHQTPGGVTARVTQLALERLRAIRHSDEAIPAEDLTDDPVAVVLRYFDQANRDDWVLVDGADKHLDGDEDGEREIRAIVEALAPGNDTLQQVIDLVSTAAPGDVRAVRESNRPLRIRFSVDLGRRARAHRETYLNPKKHHSVAGVVFRSDYIKISVHHIGPGYGVN